jgi:hypothetical protein
MYRRHYGVGASLHAVLESNVNFMNTERLAHLNNSKITLIISVKRALFLHITGCIFQHILCVFVTCFNTT